MESNDVTVIAAIGALLTGFFSAYFSFRALQLNKQEERLRRRLQERTDEVRRCYRQLASYHELESLACVEMGRLTNRPEQTIRIELRDMVEQASLERPSITRNQAQARLSGLS